MLLPLRALLLEHCGVAPPTGWRHVLLTAALLGALGALAALAGNLALAFQLAGSTAGVMVGCKARQSHTPLHTSRCVRSAQCSAEIAALRERVRQVCFVLPGALYVAALRGEGGGGGRGGARDLLPRTWEEACGVGMTGAGLVSGAVALWATLEASGFGGD